MSSFSHESQVLQRKLRRLRLNQRTGPGAPMPALRPWLPFPQLLVSRKIVVASFTLRRRHIHRDSSILGYLYFLSIHVWLRIDKLLKINHLPQEREFTERPPILECLKYKKVQQFCAANRTIFVEAKIARRVPSAPSLRLPSRRTRR